MPGYREITVAGEGRPRRARAQRGAAPRDWRAALRGALSGAVGLCRESPGTAVGGVVAVAAAGLVCVNALGYQTGRHPAPILPKVPAKEIAAREPGKEAAARAAPSEPVRVIPQAEAAPKPAARDAIGDLIRSEETTASVTPRQPAKPPVREAAKPDSKSAAKPDAAGSEASVLRAQRALAKLGYAVKADGALGPGTRAALERFERDRKLPVTGEASGRTLRALMVRASQG
ncbi:peptidoglycan-binding protein [Methylobacterium sp. NEAU 140]|uniref:peptidoglycan-binding domain-containing protein n=1 Tax=Methylobacterium sp. NEAU 140 TaxID=3064945 RepID=UPI002733BD0B|nr:peptidoglycan-binding protein [Methylobacterium sp. NEAU 140]MDP4021765.1 peptidoglycan-binding protein [Methylobacterium sp. NEAU 140]